MNKSCRISCEIVKDNIPLLLGKQSMKEAGAIINIPKDKATVFDTDINPSGELYNIDEEVYYEREKSEKWNRPPQFLDKMA